MADLITMLSAAAGQVGGINPREYFNTVLYTGNGSTQSITGVGFQPDFLWVKARSNTGNNLLVDAVRGGTADTMRTLLSNQTVVEQDDITNSGQSVYYGNIKTLDSDGFTVSNNGIVSPDECNGSGRTYVAWNWKANGAGVSNTAGTITSTVSANTTAGISIVTFTSQSSGTGTVGHGLGVAPSLIITKSRAVSGSWSTYHASLGNTQVIYLDLTNAAATASTVWNNTSPTSSVFTLGTGFAGSLSLVAYCFAPVSGFSAFGSYTGNGSATGPSVTTDFEPTWLMIKRTDTTGDWIILDSVRDTANPRDKFLEPNTTDAEATGNDVDFNATGFQLKSTSAATNASGGTYIYACFA